MIDSSTNSSCIPALAEEAPKPDTDVSLEFLQQLAPNGPWILAALPLEGGGPEVKTFGPESRDEAYSWIKKHNGKRNLYFQVNSSIGNQTKKATKQDIKAMDYIHVDIDPMEGENIADEQKRILSLLNWNRPEGLPKATFIIASGAGYQAFWRLRTPLPIDGDLEKATDAELFNKKLETDLGGDSCHNVDRIMRLPGTINIPNKSKRKKGRQKALARVEHFEGERVYDINQFQKASSGTGNFQGNSAEPCPKVSKPYVSPHFLDSVKELEKWEVQDHWQQVILTGEDRLNPEKYPSRSEALFAVLCHLLRKRVPNNIVLGIMLDSRLGISESVIDKGEKRVAYANRQLRQAKSATDASWREVNDAGIPKSTYSNARIAIEKLGVTCEHNLFNGRKLVGGHHIESYAGELSDDVCTLLRQMVIDKFGFDPGKMNIHEAANSLCIENKFDPVCDYLDGLAWDGVPRIDSCLTTFFGASDNELVRAISRKMFVAAARRAQSPGSKFDTIVVLEGQQGSGKSSALAILAGNDVFSDTEIIHMESRAQQEQIRGVWIYEIGELAGLRKVDVNKVKAFASRTHDRARPAYGRYSVDEPRRCIFVGTTNESEYLRDSTGNRRFWPVDTGEIDLKGIAANRDQLWAEAALAESNGESITLPEALWDEVTQQQAARREDDPWLDILATASGSVEQDEYRVSSKHLMTSILEMPIERQLPHVGRRLADCMRRLGWFGPEKMRIGGKSVRGFRRPCSRIGVDDNTADCLDSNCGDNHPF